jgi:hypothetical protein
MVWSAPTSSSDAGPTTKPHYIFYTDFVSNSDGRINSRLSKILSNTCIKTGAEQGNFGVMGTETCLMEALFAHCELDVKSPRRRQDFY